MKGVSNHNVNQNHLKDIIMKVQFKIVYPQSNIVLIL